jgi:hypothetical protein
MGGTFHRNMQLWRMFYMKDMKGLIIIIIFFISLFIITYSCVSDDEMHEELHDAIDEEIGQSNFID